MESDLNREQGGTGGGLLLVLALPAFGLAFAYTVVTTYVPVLLTALSGPQVTGGLIAMEGVLALLVPALVGGWSDRLRTGLGGRLPFVLAGTVLGAAGLVLLPVTAGSLLGVSLALALFLAAYFTYYAPYYALFPDLVPDDARGRSQGYQGAMRSAGLLVGMAGGGVLLALWRPLPFVLATAALAAVTAVLVLGVRRQVRRSGDRPADHDGNGFAAAWRLVREHRSIRLWTLCDACWEAGIGALRTFVVLYFTKGLGQSLGRSSLALALVGVVAVAAAPVAGKLADRFGPRPVMQVSVWIFALGLLPPLVTTNTLFVAAVVPIAFAAVVLMTLPYALLMGLLPDDGSNGAGASLFGFGQGVGIIVGPVLAGTAIALTHDLPVLTFARTSGYSAVFGIAMILLVASTPLLRRIESGDADRIPEPERG